MPPYDSLSFDPPAPVAQVTLRAANGVTVADVPLLIDSDHGILGRDILASVILLLNGPSLEWSQHVPEL